jgi:hypothetical protein
MVNTQEALAELRRLETVGAELLGLDGFRLHPDGSVEAPIELILDFTAAEAPSTTPAQRFAEARQFVTVNDAPQIRWEIVSGSTQE